MQVFAALSDSKGGVTNGDPRMRRKRDAYTWRVDVCTVLAQARITSTVGVSQRSVRRNLEQYRGMSESNDTGRVGGVLG